MYQGKCSQVYLDIFLQKSDSQILYIYNCAAVRQAVFGVIFDNLMFYLICFSMSVSQPHCFKSKTTAPQKSVIDVWFDRPSLGFGY